MRKAADANLLRPVRRAKFSSMAARLSSVGLAAAMAVFALSSCDRISGLRTDAEFKTVNADCVGEALQKTPGIGAVAHSMNRSESFQITPYRGKVVTLSHLWLYGPGQAASVQLLYDGKSWKYFNGMVKMGSPWSSDKLDAYAPLMKRVNAIVEQGCGLAISERGRVERN